jgi:hypothetical protein
MRFCRNKWHFTGTREKSHWHRITPQKRNKWGYLATALLGTIAGASVITPPVLPLVVWNPYLSLWLNARGAPWNAWPIFWHGQEVGELTPEVTLSG